MALLVTLALATLVGIALGLLGGGGSILTLPILKYVVGMDAHVAVAASLFVVGATSLAALVPHARNGRVVWRTGLVFGGASMLGAFGAGRFAKLVPAGVLLVLFALMMVVTAVAMLRARTRAPLDPSVGEPAPRRFDARAILKIGVEGLVVGGITGLVGAGGGFLVVPALTLLGGLSMPAAVGTSLLVIALKSFAGFAGHASQVSLDWPLVLAVTGMALVGSLLGARAVGLVEPAKLRRGFGWFVVVMAVFMLAQELPPLLGEAWPIGVALILALATTIVAVLVERALARRCPRTTVPSDRLPQGSS